ncbi:MAG: tetratricopeptide repeat protein [Nitrospirae bacterium]|nr:tetratricopeptide repeat protein [Nitrospirota bacterium]
MSIIHEALKKATRDEVPGPAVEGSRTIRFATQSAFLSKDILLRIGLFTIIMAVAFLAYVERDALTRIFATRRVQAVFSPSPSVELPAPSSSGDRATFSKPSPQPEPVNSKSTAASHEKSGVSYLEQGKLSEAERELLLAVSLDPESSAIQTDLGLVFKKQGRDGEAESRYQSALRLDARNVQAMNNLGLLYERQNRLEEAKRLYQKAVTTQPNFPDPHLNYAVLLERAGYFEESKRQYQTFLALATRKHEQAVQLVKKHLDRLP